MLDYMGVGSTVVFWKQSDFESEQLALGAPRFRWAQKPDIQHLVGQLESLGSKLQWVSGPSGYQLGIGQLGLGDHPR